MALTPATAQAIGYSMLGVSFCEVGGTAKDISSLFTDDAKTALIGGYGLSDSDTLMVWVGKGYSYFYYSASDWSEEIGDGEEDEYKNNQWLNLSGEVADYVFEPGSAAWFCRAKGNADPVTVTIAGEVPTNSFSIVVQPDSYAMIAHPTPVQFDLNQCEVSWTDVQGGYGLSDADTIMVWTGTGYTYYYFSASDWSEEIGDGEEDEYKNNKWLTLSGEPVTTPIDLSKGFWFKRNGTTVLTLIFPPFGE